MSKWLWNMATNSTATFVPLLFPVTFPTWRKFCASPSIADPWVGYYLFLGYLCCSNYPASTCCSFCFLLSILVTQHVSSSGFLKNRNTEMLQNYQCISGSDRYKYSIFSGSFISLMYNPVMNTLVCKSCIVCPVEVQHMCLVLFLGD